MSYAFFVLFWGYFLMFLIFFKAFLLFFDFRAASKLVASAAVSWLGLEPTGGRESQRLHIIAIVRAIRAIILARRPLDSAPWLPCPLLLLQLLPRPFVWPLNRPT